MQADADVNEFLLQYKLTVPKVGYISDLCASLSNLSEVPAEKVSHSALLHLLTVQIKGRIISQIKCTVVGNIFRRSSIS